MKEKKNFIISSQVPESSAAKISTFVNNSSNTYSRDTQAIQKGETFKNQNDFLVPSQKLSEKELEKRFSELDPHAKGYVTDEDFEKTCLRRFNSCSREKIKTFFGKFRENPNSSCRIHFSQFREIFKDASASDVDTFFQYFSEEAIEPIDHQSSKAENSSKIPSWVLFTSGAIAGATARTLTAPIDRIKIFMQVAQHDTQIISLTRSLIKQDGFLGLFRGNGTNTLKIMPETATKMFAFDRFKRWCSSDPENPKTFDRFVAGGLAGLTAATLIYPMDLAKTKLALAHGNQYNGFVDCIRKVYRSEGFFGLYRGWLPTAIGGVPFAAIDLGVFNTLKDMYVKKNRVQPSASHLLLFGSISCMTGQTLTFPLFVVRTRMQGQSKNNLLYSSMMDCLNKTYRNEGVRGLFRGLIPNYMKGAPSISITYLIFEKLKHTLNPNTVKR